MSYRDMRNFTEMMRALGYPRLISMENFRQPNFGLVAEILAWLVKQYDPQADIPSDTDTEQDRVIFVKSVAQFMATKAHIRLNTKKLYQADGHAVREVLKITSILYNAIKTAETNLSSPSVVTSSVDGEKAGDDNDDDDDESGSNAAQTAINEIQANLADLKMARGLASEITTRGASLYDHLSREAELRELRTMALSRPLEITEVESGIVSSKAAVEKEIDTAERRIENMKKDQGNLEGKIKKKDGELERNMKRLKTLKAVRPPWIDDYEKLEVEVAELYRDYLDKFRNVAYLEDQLETLNREEMEKLEETEANLRRMAEKQGRGGGGDKGDFGSLSRSESPLGGRGDVSPLHAEDGDDDDDDDSDDDDDDDGKGDRRSRRSRSRGIAGKMQGQQPGKRGMNSDSGKKGRGLNNKDSKKERDANSANMKKMYGSMAAGSDGEESESAEDSEEIDGDTDLISNDDEDDDDLDDGESEDDDDETEIEIGGAGMRGSGGKAGKKAGAEDDTDDDF